jgi:hypothetical protein
MAKVIDYYPGEYGRSMILDAIKRRLKPGLILFSICSLLIIIFGVLGIVWDNWVLVVVCMFFLLPFLIPAIVFLVKYLRPMSCKPLKRDPQLLDKADRLFRSFTFQNEAAVASTELFAFKPNLTRVIATEEVLVMYKRIVSTNYGTQYFIVVETVRDSFQMSYPKAVDSAIDAAVQAIAQYCRYVRLGHSEDNLKYVEYMRTMWQEAEKTKNSAGFQNNY